jgi:hypothetical protein
MCISSSLSLSLSLTHTHTHTQTHTHTHTHTFMYICIYVSGVLEEFSPSPPDTMRLLTEEYSVRRVHKELKAAHTSSLRPHTLVA